MHPAAFPNSECRSCSAAFHAEQERGRSFPSACTPQAWASGAVFLLLQSCLGIEIDAAEHRVTVRRPILPDWLNHVALEKIPIGDGSVSIDFERSQAGVDVTLREGCAELVRSD